MNVAQRLILNLALTQVAGNQGRAVGKTIAEGKGQPFVKVPVFWSAREYEGLRDSHSYSRMVHRGSAVALLRRWRWV